MNNNPTKIQREAKLRAELEAQIKDWQSRKIHALLGKCRDVNDGYYRRILKERFSVATSKALTFGQAMKLIEWLEKQPQKGDTDEEKATPSQIAMLRDILAQCGMEFAAAAQWARRMAKCCDDPRPLTSLEQLSKREASVAIPIAKRMYYSYHGVEFDPSGLVLHRRREMEA